MEPKLDPLNSNYLKLLQMKNLSVDPISCQLKIADANSGSSTETLAYSTAIAPKSLMDALPTTAYETLTDPSGGALSKKAVLHRKKMFAGIGSSIQRNSHLLKHRKEGGAALGAKGTDLFIKIPHPKDPKKTIAVSFAEVQILQGILAADRGDYEKVVFEDLVSDETQKALGTIWEHPCLLDSSCTYNEYVTRSRILSRGNSTVQAGLPTLTPEGKTSFNRVAPGGHGFFGFETVRHLLNSPENPEAAHVSFLSNGEDLAAYPEPTIVGWLLKNEIPLCMVVTEKTESDRKGGQVAIVAEKGIPKYITLIETAQAKASGQLQLFEDLGLSIKRDGQAAYFNTNLAIFNENVLRSRLLNLKKAVGEEKLLEALAPDLIHNWKEQTDKDGIKRKYLQLEGAMGSVFLNLDRFSREVTGNPLVHFLLVSKKDRSKFFAPIKTAFDLFLQYYSGEYNWDPIRLCPISKRPGQYPNVQTESDDVETVLEHFKNADLSPYFRS